MTCPQINVGDIHYLEALMYILEISWSTLDWGSKFKLCTVDLSKSKIKKKLPALAEQVFDTCGHLKSLRNQNF